MIICRYLLLTLIFTAIICFELKANSIVDDNNKYSEEYLKEAKENFIKQNGNLIIGDVNVTGLQRTKKKVVVNSINVNKNATLEDFNPYLAVNNLQKKGIFSSLDLDYSKNAKGEVDINLHLEDKWTLIPIPIISSSSERSSVGLMLIETNFLGLQKMLAVGGVYSSTGSSAVLIYRDPKVLDTNISFIILTALKSSILKSSTLEGVLYQEYKSLDKTMMMGFGYEFNDNFKIETKSSYTKVLIDDGYKYILNTINDYEIIDYAISATLDLQNYQEYFNYGFYSKVDAINSTINSSDNKDNFSYGDLDLSYSVKAFKKSRLKLQTKTGGGEIPFIAQSRNGGKTGFMSLPSETLAIKNYANYTITMEHSIYASSWGLASFSYFWENGIFNGGLKENLENNNEYQYYYAPGVGIQVYLKDIAIPAIGFTYAQNLVTNKGYFKFVAGLSF